LPGDDVKYLVKKRRELSDEEYEEYMRTQLSLTKYSRCSQRGDLVKGFAEQKLSAKSRTRRGLREEARLVSGPRFLMLSARIIGNMME
jgi:hypothetical protein